MWPVRAWGFFCSEMVGQRWWSISTMNAPCRHALRFPGADPRQVVPGAGYRAMRGWPALYEGVRPQALTAMRDGNRRGLKKSDTGEVGAARLLVSPMMVPIARVPCAPSGISDLTRGPNRAATERKITVVVRCPAGFWCRVRRRDLRPVARSVSPHRATGQASRACSRGTAGTSRTRSPVRRPPARRWHQRRRPSQPGQEGSRCR